MAHKPRNSYRNLFSISLAIICLCLFIVILSPKLSISFSSSEFRIQKDRNPPPEWFNLIEPKIRSKNIKIGFVNIDDEEEKRKLDLHHERSENIHVKFDRVNRSLVWSDFYPEWIDEKNKTNPPKCPVIPLNGDVGKVDVVVARTPCDGWSEERGLRDVFRLQVNLVVANLVVESGWITGEINRTVYVVFIGSCGPMREMFRCDDMVTHVGDYWVYKPDLRRLKQKVLMPVGSCQIAPSYSQPGKEVWRGRMGNPDKPDRKAYVTILHSSEEYVCGAITLAQSIIRTGSKKHLILLHDKFTSPNSISGLKSAGWTTRLIERIHSPFSKKYSYNEWNYSKLRAWQLTDYDKIIFIDADLLLLKNIDHFFNHPELTAASNDQDRFNSGLMLIEPSVCTFNELISKSHDVKTYNGGDQGFLNEMFTWWHRWPKNLNYLKISSPTTTTEGIMGKQGYVENELGDDVYAVHYLGWKPWMCYRDYDCNWDMFDRRIYANDVANKKWWVVHDSMPEGLQKYCGMRKEWDVRIKKWRKIASNNASGFPDKHYAIQVQDPRRFQFIQ